MSLSVEELVKIQDLPDFLRTEHCYNDLQHAMLVILFRHGLVALDKNDNRYADQLIDNISLYLYIHFLNEEEGMAFNLSRDLIDRDGLSEHSEMHLRFLDHWKEAVLFPHKAGDISTAKLREALGAFYNTIIKHIDHNDQGTYGNKAVELSADDVRTELARISKTRMPMSPFMAGAYDMVRILDADVAATLDQKRLSPMALKPLNELNLVENVGRILKGDTGSLRDRFAATTNGDVTAKGTSPRLYVAA